MPNKFNLVIVTIFLCSYYVILELFTHVVSKMEKELAI